MVASVRAALLLLAIGCSGPGARSVQAPVAAGVCARIPAGQPTSEVIHGVVIDGRDGVALEGAGIEAVRADRGEAWWLSLDSFQTRTATDGSYALALPPGVYLARVTSGEQETLWVNLVARAHAMRRLDARIDRGAPAGVTEVIDVGRAPIAIVPDCEWTCPADQSPPPGWWRGAMACPAGTRLIYERGPNRAAIDVSCQTPDGVRHGPYAAWATGKAAGTYGWYERGKQCGAWRTGDPAGDPAPTQPPARGP